MWKKALRTISLLIYLLSLTVSGLITSEAYNQSDVDAAPECLEFVDLPNRSEFPIHYTPIIDNFSKIKNSDGFDANGDRFYITVVNSSQNDTDIILNDGDFASGAFKLERAVGRNVTEGIAGAVIREPGNSIQLVVMEWNPYWGANDIVSCKANKNIRTSSINCSIAASSYYDTEVNRLRVDYNVYGTETLPYQANQEIRFTLESSALFQNKVMNTFTNNLDGDLKEFTNTAIGKDQAGNQLKIEVYQISDRYGRTDNNPNFANGLHCETVITLDDDPKGEEDDLDEEDTQSAIAKYDFCKQAGTDLYDECITCVYGAGAEPNSKPKRIWTSVGCLEIEGNKWITSIFNIFLGISGGVALLFILFGAFSMTTSAGDPQKLQAGREMVTSAIIGLVFILLSIVIMEFIGVNVLGIPGL